MRLRILCYSAPKTRLIKRAPLTGIERVDEGTPALQSAIACTCFLSARTHVPVHNAHHLLAHVLCAPEGAALQEVLVAPHVGELVLFPRVVHGQQRQVVA